ncbi:helix-turn-helix domain-containing protein [Noviherbaspirillum malthae]|uniref:helix-turn-helix domain-containing protein n=1 Tax=Noviherbaspirillum malthae TaxID=1260987 RepID=UPI001E4E5766|nr:helix-turn-helix transcriptional regulator [Noviherbaspirillum malthae]
MASIDTYSINIDAISMITSAQIRAARALLRWSADELAQKAGVGIATVKRFELMDNVPEGRTSTLQAIQRTLELAGVEFIGTPDDGPGVRLRIAPPTR